MFHDRQSDKPQRWGLTLVLALLLGAATSWARVDQQELHPTNQHQNYIQQNLTSDGAISAPHIDPNLKNAWGLTFNPNSFAWVADNGTGKATVYNGAGVPQPLVVTIPLDNTTSPTAPTGIVFNSSPDFQLSPGNPATFIFATEDGVLAAWNPNVLPTTAVTVATSSNGAVFKGLALAGNGNSHLLFVTDFHNDRVDVFDANFLRVTTPAGTFVDPKIPAGFAPFGIQNINNSIFVTYAKQDQTAHDDVPGPGLGFVSVFDTNGRFIQRFASRGALNAPWGMALAPADFGPFSNSLIVGNFGDGTLNAFDFRTGRFLGSLSDTRRHRLTIDGLWGLAFGNGVQGQPTNALFFTAGPNDEANGLFGRIVVEGANLTPITGP